MTKKEFEQANKDEIVVIDIREPEELIMLPSIPGAVNIPMGQILQAVENGELPKDKMIVTVCRSGGRCFVVNDELAARGYNVDYLEGGLVGYKQ